MDCCADKATVIRVRKAVLLYQSIDDIIVGLLREILAHVSLSVH